MIVIAIGVSVCGPSNSKGTAGRERRGMFQIPLQEKLDRENDRRRVTRGGGKENLNTDHCGAQRAKKKSEDEKEGDKARGIDRTATRTTKDGGAV